MLKYLENESFLLSKKTNYGGAIIYQLFTITIISMLDMAWFWYPNKPNST